MRTSQPRPQSTAAARRNKAPDKKKKAALRNLGRVLLTLFLVCVISSCIIVGVIIVYIVNVDDGSIDLSQAKLSTATMLYATDASTGKTAAIKQFSNTETRIWADLDKIPVNMREAFICTEDKRFYEHNGVDYGRTLFSFANMIFHFRSEQGGSTITQQLVKLVADINTRRIPGKIKQIVMALNLEKSYSKDQILEAYLNEVPLGGTLCGVETAAKAYFKKNIWQCDLAQCASLAAITKSPVYYNPLLHPDHNAARRKMILRNMLQQEAITQTQYDKAVSEKLTFSKSGYRSTSTSVNSYFVDQVIYDVLSDLQTKKGYTKTYAQHLLYSGGLQIYTTENPRVQSIMEKIYASSSSFPTFSGKTQPQSAMIITNYTGGIVGIIGGRGTKKASLVLDRATQSKRQPGSSIKPLAVYGPAIEQNIITWSTLIKNRAVTLSDGKLWPKNDDGSYGSGGMTTVTEGLARSLNTIAAQILQKMDWSGYTSYKFLTQKLGFTSLVKSDIGHWIGIGALTNGVTLREMAGGYGVFGNGGKYYGTYTYTKVLDSNGNVILQNTPSSTQALSPDTACVMNKLLQQNVNAAYGTGRAARFGSMPVAGKTGTTSSYKDRWFCGLTPYYVGVVWFGYDSSKAMYNMSNPSVRIWRLVMQQVSASQKIKDFPTDGSVVKKYYYLNSGKTAAAATSGTAVGWYRESDIPETVSEPVAASVSRAVSSKTAASSRTASSRITSSAVSQAISSAVSGAAASASSTASAATVTVSAQSDDGQDSRSSTQAFKDTQDAGSESAGAQSADVSPASATP